MRYRGLTPLRPIAFPAKIEPPGDTLIVVVKATLDLVPGGTATLAAAQRDIVAAETPYADALGNAPLCDSDLAPYKPRADILVTGTCHPPGGWAQRCTVGVTVGAWTKSVSVVGDRLWIAEGNGRPMEMTDPKPFRAMPLRWELAFGDVDIDANPYGRGIRPMRDEQGHVVRPLPNIEHPRRPIRRPDDRPPPAGLAPVGEMVPSRWKKRGTYDRAWTFRRRPYPPEDLDWETYNAAPPDQQVEGFLTGDETIRLEHMHPSHPQLETRLPGLRPRSFLAMQATGAIRFTEVVLRLDTLWIDGDATQAVLLWRGWARLPAARDADGDQLLVFHETPGRPDRSRQDAWHLLTGEPAAPEPPAPSPSPSFSPQGPDRAEVARALDEARAEMRGAGVSEAQMARLDGIDDPGRFQAVLQAIIEAEIGPPPA